VPAGRGGDQARPIHRDLDAEGLWRRPRAGADARGDDVEDMSFDDGAAEHARGLSLRTRFGVDDAPGTVGP
jgi:hypothetical protein